MTMPKKSMVFRESAWWDGAIWFAEIQSRVMFGPQVKIVGQDRSTRGWATKDMPKLRRAAFACARDLGYEPEMQGENDAKS